MVMFSLMLGVSKERNNTVMCYIQVMPLTASSYTSSKVSATSLVSILCNPLLESLKNDLHADFPRNDGGPDMEKLEIHERLITRA